MSRRAGVHLAAILAALALVACGGGDEQAAEPSDSSGRADAAAPVRASGGGDDGSSRGSRSELETDPTTVRGAIVTADGIVQTSAPSAGAQRTAQRNSYSSIKRFGVEASGGEATDITFALVQYLSATASGDWKLACARLYSPVIPGVQELAAGIAGRTPDDFACPAALEAVLSRVPGSELAERAEIDVSSVRRGEGDRAFVIYKTPGALSADMPLFLERGVWKVGAIEAYVLTPEQVG